MKTLTICVGGLDNLPDAVKVYSPGGEDITECLSGVQMQYLGPGVIPTATLEAYYTTGHIDPVVNRLAQAINQSCEKHIREMKVRNQNAKSK